MGDPILLTKNDLKLDIWNVTLGHFKLLSEGQENNYGEIALDDVRDIQIDDYPIDSIQLVYAKSLY